MKLWDSFSISLGLGDPVGSSSCCCLGAFVSLLVLQPTLALRSILECVCWSKVAAHRPVNPASLFSNSSVDSRNLSLSTANTPGYDSHLNKSLWVISLGAD